MVQLGWLDNKYVTLFNADCSSEMIISLNRMITKPFFVRKKTYHTLLGFKLSAP